MKRTLIALAVVLMLGGCADNDKLHFENQAGGYMVIIGNETNPKILKEDSGVTSPVNLSGVKEIVNGLKGNPLDGP